MLFDQPQEHRLRILEWRLRRISAGLAPTADDVVALLKMLVPPSVNDERWRDLVQFVRHDHSAGAEVRAAARPFAAHRPDLLRWLEGLAEPKIPRWQIKEARRERKLRARQAVLRAENRGYFADRIDKIRAGDFTSIIDLALAYLGLFRDIGAEGVPAHARIDEWVGTEISEAACTGFEAFLALGPAEPTPDDIVAGIVDGQQWNAANILVVALAERRRRGMGFDDLQDERLLAGLFELRRSKVDTHAGINGLEDAIEAEVRARGLWMQAMRRYHEPQLEARRVHVDGLSALMRDNAFGTESAQLATDWLMRFSEMPGDPEAELIDRLLRSGHYDELRSAARTRQHCPTDAHRRNWDVAGLISDFDATVARLQALPIDPELIWHVRDRTKVESHEHTLLLGPPQLEWLVSSFRGFWPVIGYPSGGTVGNTNPWDATEYLVSLIRRLGNDASDHASAALGRLANAPFDGYTETIKSVASEQLRIRAESAYVPPTLDALFAIVWDRLPVSIADLQALMLDELEIVQRKLRSDDAESWRGFYDDRGVPFEEERCRDHVLGLLRQGSQEVTFEPETHVAADKEVDITCSVRTLRVPIEIKGQWHPELWRAADSQLGALYTRDWRAGGRGIYLVLWFGDQVPPHKKLRSPGRGVELPSTPIELREMLASRSRAVSDGLVSVVVLEVARS